MSIPIILGTIFVVLVTIARAIAYFGIGLILVALFVRWIASMFGFDERVAFIRFLAYITDTFPPPVRRYTPSMGMFNFSYLIVGSLLVVLQILFLQALS